MVKRGRAPLPLKGKRFGRLLVVARAVTAKAVSNPGRHAYWLCQCDCGRVVEVRASSLIGGATNSCGCLRMREAPKPAVVEDHPRDAFASEPPSIPRSVKRQHDAGTFDMFRHRVKPTPPPRVSAVEIVSGYRGWSSLNG